VAVHLLELWVWIPPGVWMSVSCECCVLSGRGLCVRLIICPEESYWVWWRLTVRRPWPNRGCCIMKRIHTMRTGRGLNQDCVMISHGCGPTRHSEAAHTHTHTHLYVVCTEIWHSASKYSGFFQLTYRRLCSVTAQFSWYTAICVWIQMWQYTWVGQNGMPWSSAAFSC